MSLFVLIRERIAALPVITTIYILGSCFLTYAIAVGLKHVEPDFPYISYTATKLPERCIFAELINIGAFLLALNVYIRYLFLCKIIDNTTSSQHWIRMNLAALITGMISALGLTLVANFQTDTLKPVHYTGAGFAFIIGAVYCWLQTIINWKYKRMVGSNVTLIVQIANAVLMSSLVVIFAITRVIYGKQKKAGVGTKHDKLRGIYLTSTISEWLLAVAILVYILTFYKDFLKIRLEGPVVRFKNEEQRQEMMDDHEGRDKETCLV